MADTKIRKIRKAKGMTLQDVADKIGTTAVTVSRWEREPQRVTVPVLGNLARVLDCRPSELLASSVSDYQVHPVTPADGSGFNAELIRQLCGVDAENLLFVRAVSDAMAPTIAPGDFCFVHAGVTPTRAGIFCVRRGDVAAFVRATPSLVGDAVNVTLDNQLYMPLGSTSTEDFAALCIGRVCFIGKHV